MAELGLSDNAGGEKHGYRFTLAGTLSAYSISAVPVTSDQAHPRTFFSDQSLVIRESYGKAAATVNSPTVRTVSANYR